MTLELENIVRFFGTKLAVKDLNLKIESGEVLGLLGHNGAGKTTTIRMILGLLKQDSGSIRWNNETINRNNLKIGYLPEERGLYPKDKVYKQLKYFSKLEGLSNKEAEIAINRWLRELDMEQYRDMYAGDLSKGNQQKVQLIAALVHDPDLVILDEPFSGLDPINTEMLKEVIRKLIKLKKTVIFSSHRMENVEEFCEKICILKNGRMVLYGDLSEIKGSYGYKNVIIDTDKDITEKLKDLKVDYRKFKSSYHLTVENIEKIQPFFLDIINDKQLHSLIIKEPTLNQIFVEKVGE
ncbi:ABC transporter ATP-binding protein [Priestia endophytica]|uniref:ABC transporter ATP-binding protein n=1 Tax=Priestia endophytica TaxID=135735 RepID=UPI002E22CAA6|nr:ATP-binding cassette domain-containing protein [Priestia endophytica]MED4071265.1 ATP-binding cassette domain-containing protein [Priestia endophytica]